MKMATTARTRRFHGKQDILNSASTLTARLCDMARRSRSRSRIEGAHCRSLGFDTNTLFFKKPPLFEVTRIRKRKRHTFLSTITIQSSPVFSYSRSLVCCCMVIITMLTCCAAQAQAQAQAQDTVVLNQNDPVDFNSDWNDPKCAESTESQIQNQPTGEDDTISTSPGVTEGEVVDNDQVIGDGVRSDASSSSFFQFVDTDGDGILEAPELADIIERIAETSQFNVSSVKDEVDRVMKKLDRNDEEGLEISDVFAYWMQLESLLTVDEVVDWIVYAVQMPPAVGKAFKENFVTGYDFPELVENEGAALRSEQLHIESASFRKKIVRHIYARLLDIGSKPTPPSNVKYQVESCTTVSFSWGRSTASGFPVHSYRVQRRGVHTNLSQKSGSGSGLDPDSGSDSISVSSAIGAKGSSADNQLPAVSATRATIANGSGINRALQSDWETIYVGGETDFVDGNLERGKNYFYRFQAWNSVGRSEPWVPIDISRALKWKKCAVAVSRHEVSVPLNDEPNGWTFPSRWTSLFKGTFFFGQCLMALLRGIITIIALISAAMRFKRATAKTSTSRALEPMFPWLWNGLNSFFARVLGVEMVPSSSLGNKSTLKRAQNKHDESVNAVGLHGYKNDDSFLHHADRLKRRSIFQERRRSRSFNDLTRIADDCLDDDTKNPKNGKNVSFNEVAHLSADRNGSLLGREISSERTSRESSCNFSEVSESERLSNFEDDDETCNTCRKRYKFGKRKKHHCARCLSTFCHKHGHTTHSSFTSCQVPGSCVCNVCLEIEQFNRHDVASNATENPKRAVRRVRKRCTKSNEDRSL